MRAEHSHTPTARPIRARLECFGHARCLVNHGLLKQVDARVTHYCFCLCFCSVFLHYLLKMSSAEEENNSATEDSSGADSEENVWNEEPLKKRVRNPSNWKKNIAKRKRDSGEAYVGVGPTKRHVEAKTLGPPCTCPRKCYDVVGADNAQLIFNKYWEMASHNAQTRLIVANV